jgi:purine-nucleoside phosphorylase
MTDFDAFRAAVAAHGPRTAVVLGSGLGAAADGLAVAAAVGYAGVPGLVPPTVRGHGGRLAVGKWGGVPAVVCFGRVHFYEGHPWERVTALVRLLADLGIRSVLLTNAAGGIRPDLTPGSLMAIRGHLKLIEPDGWKRRPTPASPYSPRLTALLEQGDFPAGTYAALTGPCYETPAEILALRYVGADAVGMSTAVEAEAAAGFGLEVAGLSCITNQAAGLSAGPLSHAEVEDTARDAVGRVADRIGRFVATA